MSPSLPPRAPGRFSKYFRNRKVKLLWARIISTPCISLFFGLSLVTSIVLMVLQGIAYRDNDMAVVLTSAMLKVADIEGFPVMKGDSLEVCTMDGAPTPLCSRVPAMADPNERRSQVFGGLNLTELDRLLSTNVVNSNIAKRSIDISPALTGDRLTGVRVGDTVLSLQCVRSMVWLNETLKDAKREDIVILVFHAWLLFVSVWTVLNESIPHLVVALAAHILGTAWAGVRIQTAKDWYSMYRRHVMFGSCDGVDVFGDWWDLRARNATPVVFINAMTTFAFAYLTIAIFRTYMKHTVTRAGAPKVVQRVYKLVALFSASLHLATFFNLASAAIWLSKITVGRLKDVSDHIELYLGLVIVGLVLEFPWILIGWICVRKECYIRFWLFVVIGTIPFVFATVLFASQIYGFIFHTWPFFATITITSYIFTITTLITGVICRTQFGKGLAHFLQVEAALASLDFTPANLSSDLEKAGTRSEIISFSGMPAFPDSPSETKHLRAVPSLSAISSKHRSVLPSDNLSLRTSSIFTVPMNRRQSGQTVLDLRELPAARTRSPSFRFTRTLSKQPSIQESIISTTTTHTNGNTNAPSPLSKNTFDIVETAPVLAPITPVSSFRVLPPHRTPSNLSVITSVPPTSLRAPRDRSPLSSSDSASTRSGNSPSRPPGLGLPTRPSEAVRPALSRRPRTPPESDSPSIPLPPLPLSRTDV